MRLCPGVKLSQQILENFAHPFGPTWSEVEDRGVQNRDCVGFAQQVPYGFISRSIVQPASVVETICELLNEIYGSWESKNPVQSREVGRQESQITFPSDSLGPIHRVNHHC